MHKNNELYLHNHARKWQQQHDTELANLASFKVQNYYLLPYYWFEDSSKVEWQNDNHTLILKK